LIATALIQIVVIELNKLICIDKITQAQPETYILYTELANSIVHQDSEVFDCHPHIPIGPTALVWPVLVAFVLKKISVHDKYLKCSSSGTF